MSHSISELPPPKSGLLGVSSGVFVDPLFPPLESPGPGKSGVLSSTGGCSGVSGVSGVCGGVGVTVLSSFAASSSCFH